MRIPATNLQTVTKEVLNELVRRLPTTASIPWPRHVMNIGSHPLVWLQSHARIGLQVRRGS